ncbi:hypothetical protein GT755_18750 [Herbidospora sp. NEAU-GS84]|uniref:DUF4232 domain-containing protein n=1 Tax=Herbidospora solisilvae TaxID=2696284 RepID=A0A7C9J3W9_9ACTN|nr:hypothetical protein [Herbidospora solisilvae]NAS23725.1 hypothetical protein [Herbidospora solisilvae]
MDPDTFRGEVVEGPDVYWRRRVLVLTGVLVVGAVIAWAFTNGPDTPLAGTAPAKGASDALIVSLPSPSAPSPSSSGTPTPSATPSPTRAPAKRDSDTCDPKDLVVNLTAGREVYTGADRPGFMLTVVNTAKNPCKVDVGPRALEMRITSGPARIWSTADCVSGSGVDRQILKRGIPYVRSIEWDRNRSGDSCTARSSVAGKGTYVATARSGSLRSKRNVFHLR